VIARAFGLTPSAIGLPLVTATKKTGEREGLVAYLQDEKGRDRWTKLGAQRMVLFGEVRSEKGGQCPPKFATKMEATSLFTFPKQNQ